MQDSIMQALETGATRITDLAETLGADPADVRGVIFDDLMPAGKVKRETIRHDGGSYAAFSLGSERKSAKAGKRGRKSGRKGKSPAAYGSPEAEGVSLRMRVSLHEDGKYTVLVRKDGKKQRITAGKCDDAAEAASVALTKVLA